MGPGKNRGLAIRLWVAVATIMTRRGMRTALRVSRSVGWNLLRLCWFVLAVTVGWIVFLLITCLLLAAVMR